MLASKSVVLKEKLENGLPGPENFDIVSEDIPFSIPENSILLSVLVISADPYLRSQLKSYGQTKVGQKMSGFIAVSLIYLNYAVHFT